MVSRIAVIVLAGGRGERLGRVDKGHVLVDGRPLIRLILDRVLPQGDICMISARIGQGDYSGLGLPVVFDGQYESLGPLNALTDVMDMLADQHADIEYVLTVPSDTPFLPVDLASRLLHAVTAHSVVAACAQSGGRRHPLIGLWPLAGRKDMRTLLKSGERSFKAFLRDKAVAWVEWSVAGIDPFFNINTPEDLHAARSWSHTGPR